MSPATRRPRLLIAAAALLTAVALTLVPGALATKGGKHQPPAPPAAPLGDTLLTRGATTLSLDAGTAAALTSLGVQVAPVRPAGVDRKGRIAFPITFGLVDSATLAGQIRHAGGLKATKGATTVYLTRYFIDLDETPTLSGLVGTSPNTGQRVELFELDLGGLTVEAGRRSITLGNVALTLTDDAAAALNGAFGDGAAPFAEGLAIGTASVTARTWTKGL